MTMLEPAKPLSRTNANFYRFENEISVLNSHTNAAGGICCYLFLLGTPILLLVDSTGVIECLASVAKYTVSPSM